MFPLFLNFLPYSTNISQMVRGAPRGMDPAIHYGIFPEIPRIFPKFFRYSFKNPSRNSSKEPFQNWTKCFFQDYSWNFFLYFFFRKSSLDSCRNSSRDFLWNPWVRSRISTPIFPGIWSSLSFEFLLKVLVDFFPGFWKRF